MEIEDFQERDGFSRASSFDLTAFLREHPGTALSLGYLALVVLGATYEFFLFRELGANVFYYAEPTDFLLAPFRDPVTLLFPMASALVALFAGLLDRFLRRRSDLYRRFSERSGAATMGAAGTYALVILVYFINFAVTYADHTGEQIINGNGRTVRIVPTQAANLPPLPEANAADDPGTGILVGTSARFMFIYRQQDNKLLAVPNDAIGSVVFDVPKPSNSH